MDNTVLTFGRGVKTRQVVKTKCSLTAQDGGCGVNGHHVKPEPYKQTRIRIGASMHTARAK